MNDSNLPDGYRRVSGREPFTSEIDRIQTGYALNHAITLDSVKVQLAEIAARSKRTQIGPTDI